MTLSQLKKVYPWIGVTTTLERYIDPIYYDNILKAYVFDGEDDLSFLKNYLKQIPDHAEVLELGSGTGRSTNVALETAKHIRSLTLVDLSKRMLDWCKKNYHDRKNVRYVNSDTIDFFLNTNNEFDSVYSLWAFSHTVHQNLKTLGLINGKNKVRSGIRKFLTKNLRLGGSFFLIHFDSLSEEQRISIRQRKVDNFIFSENREQSLSKRIIDELLGELSQEGLIRYTSKRYIGSPIQFSSLNEALEYYCNFHMESHFNKLGTIEKVINGLNKDLRKYQDRKGVIRIKPGCFIYEIQRIK